jgi:hypothetical protein
MKRKPRKAAIGKGLKTPSDGRRGALTRAPFLSLTEKRADPHARGGDRCKIRASKERLQALAAEKRHGKSQETTIDMTTLPKNEEIHPVPSWETLEDNAAKKRNLGPSG